jgi:hypothetical protein
MSFSASANNIGIKCRTINIIMGNWWIGIPIFLNGLNNHDKASASLMGIVVKVRITAPIIMKAN